MSKLAEARDEIRRHRALHAVGTGSFVDVRGAGVVRLLRPRRFAGPGPLSPPAELVAGAIAVALVSLIVSSRVAKHRLEHGAEEVVSLLEGRHARRVLIFAEYVLIDDEIIPRAAIRSADVEESGLVLRYEDPDCGGVVLRELEATSVACSASPSASRHAPAG